MRETPIKNQIKARELFLDAHKPLIAHIYCLPTDELVYDNTITELMYKQQPAGKVVTDFLKCKEGTDRVLSYQQQYKNKLYDILHNPTDDYIYNWDKHMDYESIVLDKMINFNILPINCLVLTNTRSFFEQQQVYTLLHQGYQLSKIQKHHEKSQWFSQFNDEWYLSHTITKLRLIDLLQKYSEKWEQEYIKSNKVQYNNLDDIYKELTNIHRSILVRKATAEHNIKTIADDNPHLTEYIRFVTAATAYNEELRLLRSQSVVALIKGALNDKQTPYNVFLDVIQTRKQRLKNEYN